jgi:hypothetical protein
MYSIYVRLDDGDFLFVASREKLEQASQIIQELNAAWPREYVVRDSNDNLVDPPNP